MTAAIPCPSCLSDTPDGLLCATCVGKLKRALHDLPWLMDELRTTLARQSQAGTGNGGRGESALPYDWNAGHVREDVGNTLTTWVRELDMGDTADLRSTTRALCKWLTDRMERIRGHAAASEILDEITYQVGDVRRAIDRASDLVFCGSCPVCGRDMLAHEDAAEAVCRYCAWAGIESVLPVQPMRADMWARAEDELLPRRLIVQAFPVYGVEVKPSTFRTWIAKGRLRPQGERNGAPLYPLRRALELARHIRHDPPSMLCTLCWALVPTRPEKDDGQAA